MSGLGAGGPAHLRTLMAGRGAQAAVWGRAVLGESQGFCAAAGRPSRAAGP